MSEITYETFPDILFSDVGNSSIRYFDHSLTYNEAKEYCQSYYNSTLVEFWSELEWTQVTEEHFTKKLKPLKEGNSIESNHCAFSDYSMDYLARDLLHRPQ